jgi:hypothetical protein
MGRGKTAGQRSTVEGRREGERHEAAWLHEARHGFDVDRTFQKLR